MARCETSFSKRDPVTGLFQAFPCGKCYNCLMRRVSGWSFRLMREGQRAMTAHFVTLTYNTDYVPITSKGFMSLRMSDVQSFFKRLRKAHRVPHPIRYYVAGEYGGQTLRPHYHVILFNSNPEAIEKAWGLGDIHVGHVSEASIGYTLKYICKEPQIPKHKNDDRLPEFSNMSKGIGSNYLTPAMIDWHHADLLQRYYLPLKDGKKIALPKYYKSKIYDEKMTKKIAKYMEKELTLHVQKEEEYYGDAYEKRRIEHYGAQDALLKKQRLKESL